MKNARGNEAKIRLAVVDSDPLRFVGFRSLLSSESDFELYSVSLAEVGANQGKSVVLLGSHPGRNLIDVLTTMRAVRQGINVLVTGCNMDDAAILNAITAGAKGCVDEAAPVEEIVRAIRSVHSGSVWGEGLQIQRPWGFCGPTPIHNPGKGSPQNAGRRML